MKRRPDIDPDRLFLAADTILAVMNAHSGAQTLIALATDDADDSGQAPESLTFSDFELVEAMNLLIRMGYATRSRGRRP